MAALKKYSDLVELFISCEPLLPKDTCQTSLSNTFTPDPIVGNIDPATGICECNPNDPSNTFGGLTLYSGIMNPNPGIPNTTGAPNGTGPCP